jgi:uncharacterized DUF497 family protein
MITWDEPQRKTNLKKRGIDLADLESAFDFPMVTVEDDREVYGELRLKVWLCGVDGSSFWCGQSGKTALI